MDYISGWCKSKRRLDGRTAIVTGSNTGLGRETAIDLYLRGAGALPARGARAAAAAAAAAPPARALSATDHRHGCRVIMACRDINKANVAKAEIESLHHNSAKGRGSLIVKKLDLSSLSSVREFASLMVEEKADIDILVNNAGVMMSPQGVTDDGFETHMATNHFGHALLTLLLLPKLAKSRHARIVFVSSMLHQRAELDFDDINFEMVPYDPLQAYCRSKVANILFARGLSQKLREHNIRNVSTYSLHPGVISTEIGRHFSESFLRGTTWLFNNLLCWFLKSPRCGAQTAVYCAVDEQCAAQSGLYYSDCAVAAASTYAQNDTIAKELWNVTIAALNLREDKLFDDNTP